MCWSGISPSINSTSTLFKSSSINPTLIQLLKIFHKTKALNRSKKSIYFHIYETFHVKFKKRSTSSENCSQNKMNTMKTHWIFISDDDDDDCFLYEHFFREETTLRLFVSPFVNYWNFRYEVDFYYIFTMLTQLMAALMSL